MTDSLKPSFLETKAITDTLPVGFYTNRRINATLKEDIECSSYDPKHDIIEISYPQLCMGLEKITSAEDMETIIRSNYYHEVSHAIMTPKEMRPTDIINIFEDERIETLLADFYHSVDFKECVKLINGWTDDMTPPLDDPQAAFYALVRFRCGRKDLLERVEKIIHKHRLVNRNSSYYEVSPYIDDITRLYNEFDKEYKLDPKSVMGMEDKEESGEESGEGMGSSTEGEPSGEPTKGKTTADGEPTKGALDKETIQEIINQTIGNAMFNAEFHRAALQLFENFKKKNSKGSALQGHSGIINPRLADRADYKMFERSTTARGNNQFGTFHLNLFIDTSGSFSGADRECNKIIKSLICIEQSNPNFSFDVITMSKGEEIRPKEDRYIVAEGGNHLSLEIFDIFRKMQKPQTYNYNIVMFDGDAYSNDVWRSSITKWCDTKGFGFSAFANPNCTIISDTSNKGYIQKYAPTTRTIYANSGYPQQLADNVLVALQKALN